MAAGEMAHRRAPGRAGACIDHRDPIPALQREAVDDDADLRLAPARDSLVARRLSIGMDQNVERRFEDTVMQDQ
ncbi:hypothetical protein [Bosea beijingensis]|uniref:hypothetical protein n=1 Tax=Bosea beijingensis TaxID=3068632 RepID=UPI002740A7FF|nr:hypothetical protein [Bosea sp. REN20]